MSYFLTKSLISFLGLLRDEGQVQGQSGSYDRIGDSGGSGSRYKLVLSRLAILLFFLVILAAGILIRIFVKVSLPLFQYLEKYIDAHFHGNIYQR